MSIKIEKLVGNISISASKWQIKIFLSMFAFTIVIAVIMFTQVLVDELIQREQKMIRFYANIYKQYFDPNTKIEDFLFFLDEIPTTLSFPIIITDAQDNPLEEFESYTLNVDLDKSKSISEQRQYLVNYIQKMAKNYPPVIITDNEGHVLNKFYYTHSALIDKLRYFPLVAMLTIAAFIFVGYVAFSNVRRNEQSKVWVGMAREAAHQLGTPLSSLLAWIEILKFSKEDPIQIEDTLYEMENDVNRLQIITTRFSKIGSMPEMERQSLADLIEEVCLYFEKRLPHLGRKVEIVREFDDPLMGNYNTDLMAWVFENLIKNAAEAIDEKHGTIRISGKISYGKKITIYVIDSGKGMSSKLKRQIFHPGFTTKKRGWGLGLSLAKRIVEEYHHGKIFVKDSTLSKGTTFAIELPLVQHEEKHTKESY